MLCVQVKIKFSVRGLGQTLSKGVNGVTSFHYVPHLFWTTLFCHHY
jgi:hypothetical protein